MKKHVLLDFDKNRIWKTKRWLGLLTFCMMFLWGQMSFAQQTYQIGSGSGTSSYIPLYYNYEYNYSQTIYTAAELNAQGATVSGQITKIKFKPTSSVSTAKWKDWVIYLGNTTKTSFTSTSDWVAVGNLTQVFSGSLPASTTTNQWIEITLDTPFIWNGTDNIVVAVDENTAGYGGIVTWSGYTLAPPTGNKGIYKYQDTTDILPSAPPTGTRTNAVAQIQFVGDLSPGCSGTTVGGTATATPATGNSGSSFTASATGMTSGASGLEYQWQKSTDGEATWNDIAGATSVSSTIVGETGSVGKITHYRLKVTCTNSSETSYSNSVTHTLVKVYCTPTGAANNTAEIRNFTLSNLNNSSAASAGTAGYSDYSGTVTPADLNIGLPYVATILSGADTGNHGAAIWIDYNNNGNFETGEKVAWIGNTIQPNTTASFPSFTVPNTVIPGVYKLRVMYVYGVSGADLTPCSTTSTYAEIEDYSVNVLPAPACLAPTGLTLGTVAAYTADISWAAVGNASNYTWAVFADNANPTTDTPVATGTTSGTTANATGLSPATAYDFYVKSDCTVDGVSLWSTKLDFTTACVTPDAPTGITFTNVSATGTTVNYVAPGVAPTGYTIFRSTSNVPPALADGTTYTANQSTAVTSLTSGGNTYFCVYNGTALTTSLTTGLVSNTEYYYYVFSRNSTNCTPLYSTTALTSSQATAPATPGTVTMSAVTQNSATISWVASAVGGDFAPLNYTLEVYTDAGYTTHVTGSPFTVGTAVTYDVAGLAHSTTYYYRIKANNGSDSTYRTGNFVTECDAVTTMFENFDSYGTGNIVPNCWVRLAPAIAVGSQSISAGTPASGTRNMYQYASTTQNPVIVVLPIFSNIDAGTHWLRFKARLSSGTGGALTVGYVTDATDATTFTTIQTLTINNTSYTVPEAEYTVAVPNTVPANARLAIKNAADAKGYYWDDVYWEVIPTCIVPTAVTASNPTTTTIDVAWTAPITGNAPTGYDVYYSTVNTAPTASTTLDSTNSVTSATSPVTITGLNSSTTYYVWVRTDCGSGDFSSWSASASVATVCDSQPVPYTENFESVTIPAIPVCTSVVQGGNGNLWKTVSNPGSGFSSKTLQYSYHVSNVANTWFFTKGLQLESGKTYRLTFKYGDAGYTEKLKVAYGTSASIAAMTNPLLNFTTDKSSTAKNATIDFSSAATGVYYIGFQAYSDADEYLLHLDDISVVEVINATTWADNGGTLEWDNGVPTSAIDAIIDADYTGAAFEAKNLTVNLGKTLTVNSSVKAVDITNNGTIEVANGANFIQTGGFTAGTGSAFNVNVTTPDVKRLSYISWASPVAVTGSESLKIFSKGNNPSSVGTLDNRFYTYNSTSGLYSVVSDPAATYFQTATGYLIRTPNDFQLSGTAAPFYGIFRGKTPNSGPLTYPVLTTGTDEFVFTGNPYPGAMDISQFFLANAGLEANTMYVWNSQVELVGTQYMGDVYYTRSGMGWTPAIANPSSIAAGQGFFVVKPAAFAGNISFNNDMRGTTNTGTFVKAASLDRFWVELKSAAAGATSSSQVLLGFHQQATAGYDAGWDAKIMQMSQDVMYTTVDNNNLVIDVHGNFVNTDKFFVNVNTSAAGSYNISLAGKDGVFNSGQKIYIKDNVTGITGELSQGTFNFVSNGGVEPNRFEISFVDNSVLATQEAGTKDVEIYGANSTVYVKANKNIKSVKVYDLSGRLIKSVEKTNGNSVEIPVSAVKMVLVSVEMADGKIISQKIKL